jgi:hypothetical protein
MWITSAFAAFAGALAVSAAWAQEYSDWYSSYQPSYLRHSEAWTNASQLHNGHLFAGESTYSFSGVAGTDYKSALNLLLFGVPALYIDRLVDLNKENAPFVHGWQDPLHKNWETMTLGHALRNFSLAGSTYPIRQLENSLGKSSYASYYSRDAYSRRLSLVPSPTWMLQITRGHLSSLDQFEISKDLQRTTISTTYTSPFKGGGWQTTLAWGRRSTQFRENVMGYVAESTLRLGNAHTFFGRLEKVGSDDLLSANESAQMQYFKMNRFSVGYLYNVRTDSPIQFDIGGMASRYVIPSSMSSIYGHDPMTYLIFIRFKLQ